MIEKRHTGGGETEVVRTIDVSDDVLEFLEEITPDGRTYDGTIARLILRCYPDADVEDEECGSTAKWDNQGEYKSAAPDTYWTCVVCGEMYTKGDLGLHRICPPCREAKTMIVSRHKGLVQWLKTQGITGKVVTHISTPEQVKDKIVYGVIPLGLAAETLITYAVELPYLPKDMRGLDLSMEQMIKAGARLQGFKVERTELLRSDE